MGEDVTSSLEDFGGMDNMVFTHGWERESVCERTVGLYDTQLGIYQPL